ncbi:hypothetical protein Tco_0320283 [Tanacetum coccineum]
MKEVLIIDCLSIVETDKVIHTVETDIVKLVVEIESFGMSSDEFDKETGSSDGLQPKQADLSCVHALNELHLHEIRTKAATYELKWIEDLVPKLWSPVQLKYDQHAYLDPHGMIYVDQYMRKRLMRADELHKFSDGMLNDVRSALHDIAMGIRMEYLPMRKWSNLDKKRARVMVQDIDKQLYQRRLMRNLEKFVGGREYGNDLRLLERKI